jgi:glycine cleavage system H protein
MMATYPRNLQYTREHEWARIENESVKTVSELFAPVSGEVVEVNADLESSPELVNENPYEEGWLVIIRPSDQAELEGLMDAAKYEEYLGTLDG